MSLVGSSVFGIRGLEIGIAGLEVDRIVRARSSNLIGRTTAIVVVVSCVCFAHAANAAQQTGRILGWGEQVAGVDLAGGGLAGGLSLPSLAVSSVEVHKLTASDADADDIFGSSVALSGATALVGAYRNDDAGSNSGYYDSRVPTLDSHQPGDWNDFFQFAMHWLCEDSNCPSNFNQDQRVDLLDFCIFADAWSLQDVRLLRFGLITDTHNSDNPIYGNRHYMDAEKKVNLAMETFSASALDAVFHLGDIADDYNDLTVGNPTRLQSILDIMWNNPASLPVYWVLGNHDFHCSDNWESEYKKPEWLNDTRQSATYFYVDIGNLRCVILDTNFHQSGQSCNVDYQYSYLSTEELTWLEQTLQSADEAQKFSVLFSHHPMGACETYHDARNAGALREIVGRHKVIAIFSGHYHRERHSISLGNNLLGNPIEHYVLDASVNGDFEASFAAHYIVSIDDQTGTLEDISRYYTYTTGEGKYETSTALHVIKGQDN